MGAPGSDDVRRAALNARIEQLPENMRPEQAVDSAGACRIDRYTCVEEGMSLLEIFPDRSPKTAARPTAVYGVTENVGGRINHQLYIVIFRRTPEGLVVESVITPSH